MKGNVNRFFVILTCIAILVFSSALLGCSVSGKADGDVLQDTPAQQPAATPASEPAMTSPVETTPPEQQPPAAVKIEKKPQEPASSEPKQNETVSTAPETAARQKLEQKNTSKPAASESKENVAGVGTLNIISIPGGARISIDGQEKSITGFVYGITPHSIANVPAGNRKVTLQKAGYNEYTTTVFLPPGRHIEIDATLARK